MAMLNRNSHDQVTTGNVLPQGAGIVWEGGDADWHKEEGSVRVSAPD
jgi:hypothetical protein